MAGKQKRGKATSRNQNRRRQGPAALTVLHPPQLRDTVTFRHVQRYQYIGTNAAVANVGADRLIRGLFCHMASSTSICSVVNAIKIRKVEMWIPPGAPATTGAAYATTTSFMAWQADTATPNFGRIRSVQDTSFSNEPGYLKLTPDARSADGMWQSAKSNQLWQLDFLIAPQAVIQFTMDVVLNNSLLASFDNTPITTTGTPLDGILYTAYLQVNSGIPNYVPQNGISVL